MRVADAAELEADGLSDSNAERRVPHKFSGVLQPLGFYAFDRGLSQVDAYAATCNLFESWRTLS